MTIKSKTFRIFTGLPDLKNGRPPEDWQRFFSNEDIESFREGTETPEMRNDRKRFWNFARNERKRLKGVVRRDAHEASRQHLHHMAAKVLTAPKRVRIACARYWLYAHILPRGEGLPFVTAKQAKIILGLSAEDAAQVFVDVGDDVCREVADKASYADYPKHGLILQQAEGIIAVGLKWIDMKSPEPPKRLMRFIDPVNYSLGLSEHFLWNGRNRLMQYSWTAEGYETGQAKEIKAIVDNPKDYKEQLLSIFS